MSTGKRLSFDIGHSSIGWSVLETFENLSEPEILGCGSVTFPVDDCLAFKRRELRQTRRHIRATRQRIARLQQLLAHLGPLTAEELGQPGHSAPFVLAARALRGMKLDAFEFWHVLRWYAHNRGYKRPDWANDDDPADAEDTEKEENAIAAMRDHGCESMAETICAILGVDPASEKISSHLPYKTLNMAFPRTVVEDEVRRILTNAETDAGLISALLDDWRAVEVPGLTLPPRYEGGLLFGQLKPRFHNRIIGKCPFTGLNLPNKQCVDFLRFRWAMILKNIRADGNPLTAEVRRELTRRAEETGGFTAAQLKKAVDELCHEPETTNLDNYFTIHPDSEDALVLDPALSALRTRGALWKDFPDAIKARMVNRWKKRRKVDANWLRQQLLDEGIDPAAFDAAVEKGWKKLKAKNKPSLDQYQRRPLGPKPISGRAPFSRERMREAVAEVLGGFDPMKRSKANDPENGEEKPEDGCLYRSPAILDAERKKPIDQLTNNHLIRHRLRILERLTGDLIAEFADGNPTEISRVIVEVNRDLIEFSGMEKQEIDPFFRNKLWHHGTAVKKLEEAGYSQKEIGGKLIRKARLALDLDCRCPLTGERFDWADLEHLETAHVIPNSKRRSNSLHSVFLTWPEINRMQGNRTALEFIKECGGQEVKIRGRNALPLFHEHDYLKFVDGLKTKWPRPKKGLRPNQKTDDEKRNRARQRLFRIERYTEKEREFTEGDLTQTSHLVRLASRRLENIFPHLIPGAEDEGQARGAIHAIPGQITALTRRAWEVTSCLIPACPEVRDPNSKKGEALPKNDIRGLTHLHHALDAVVLGLAAHYLPRDGGLWQQLLARKVADPAKRAAIQARCKGIVKFSNDKPHLMKLPADLKNAVAARLAECRVVQHVPKSMRGLPVDRMMWGFRGFNENGRAILRKQSITEIREDGTRQRMPDTPKMGADHPNRLIGWDPIGGSGKLLDLQAVLITNENFGIALIPGAPEVIPFHQVKRRLSELRKRNGGKLVPVLRNGMLIEITEPPKTGQDYRGIWRVTSVKNNKSGVAIDMVRPGYCKGRNGVKWAGMNKGLKSLLKQGLRIHPTSLTGAAV